ncbi:hypothetical protein LUQ84_002505, partial [Hamiltosporidium tvaerminnensis]
VFSEFIEKYGALGFQNLETLILILTNLDDAIINFIISQPSLKSIELRNCTIRDEHQIDCKLTPDGFQRRIFENSEITLSNYKPNRKASINVVIRFFYLIKFRFKMI